MANFYGFEVTAKDSASSPLDKISKKLGETATKAQTDSKSINESLKSIGEGVGEKFNELRNGLLGIFAVEKIREFGAEILKTTTEFQGFDNRIKFASNSIADAGENTAFLKQQIEQLKLPAKEVYEGFSDMEMGLIGTGIEGKKLRDLFEGFTIAASVGHLTNAQTSRALYDLKELGERGLTGMSNRSLSGVIPEWGAMIKETFHKSFRELEQEGMTGAEFLEKMGPAMKKQFEGGLGNWKESLQATQNEFGNEALAFQLELGNKLEPAFKSMFKSGMEGLKSLSDIVKGLDLSQLARWAKLLAEIGGAFILLKGATIGYNTVLATFTTLEEVALWRTIALESGMGGLQATTVALTETFVGLESVLATLGGAGIAFGLIKLVEYFHDMRVDAEAAADAVTNFQKLKQQTEGNQERYNDVYNAFLSTQRDINSADVGVKTAATGRASKLLGDLPTFLTDLQNQSSDLTTQLEKAKKDFINNPSNREFDTENDKYYLTAQGKKASENIVELTQRLKQNNVNIFGLGNIMNKLKSEGIKPNGAGSENHATNASDSIGILGGAAGGLDKAKIINIKIDTLQKIGQVTGIDDFKKASNDIMDIFLRMFNNVSNGSAATI